MIKVKTKKKIPLLVTTVHKGVFFGFVNKLPKPGVKSLKIYDARCVIYWSADVKGFPGLAANGPTDGCRVSPPCKSLSLSEVTSFSEVSQAAVDAFNVAKWS